MLNVTRSIESYDSVFGMEQSIHLTVTDKPFNAELSSSESVRILKDCNDLRIEEMGLVDYYAISSEGLKGIFDRIVEIISKIIDTITGFIRKIFGKKIKKEVIEELKETYNGLHESKRAEFVREVQQKLSDFQGWFPNVDKPVFPDLSSYNVSQLKTVMSEINKINSQFIKLSEGIGLGPRATHERITDTKNMTRVLENFEEKFLNKFSVSNNDLSENGPYVAKRRGYMISMLNFKPKLYTPNSKDRIQTFSIFTDFVEKHDKFINDVNSAFLNPLKSALIATEHSVNKIKSYLDKAYGETGYKELVTLSTTYSRITSQIQRVYVFPLTYMSKELSLVAFSITNEKKYLDDAILK